MSNSFLNGTTSVRGRSEATIFAVLFRTAVSHDGGMRRNTASIMQERQKATSEKPAGLAQEDFVIRSGLGLCFVRELEQGKETVRMDKVNVALAMFGMEAVPGKKGVTSATK